jgi:hypothetical protein
MRRTFVFNSIFGTISVLAVLFAPPCAAGETTPDVATQMQIMQRQMSDMALKLEAQQKKIDLQDRTISALKGEESIIRSDDADKILHKLPEVNSNGPTVPYELPGVTVTDAPITKSAKMDDPEKIGSYGQPIWTTRRRFSETRAYVIPEGDFEFEYWDVTEKPRHGPTVSEQKYEVEIGLGHRLQLDIYGLSHSQGNNKGFAFDEHDIELRYAFADWNVIPGNPTAYAEYKFLNGEPDHVEFKALFSGDAKPCWPNLQWAANLVYETQMGQKRQSSYELTGGVSYQMGSKWAIGGETKLELDDQHGSRFRYGVPKLLLGPSFQYTPFSKLHIDFSPLIGVTKSAPEFKSLVIVGWKF